MKLASPRIWIWRGKETQMKKVQGERRTSQGGATATATASAAELLPQRRGMVGLMVNGGCRGAGWGWRGVCLEKQMLLESTLVLENN